MALPLSRPSLRRQDFDQVLDAMIHDRLAGGEINRLLSKEISRGLKLSTATVFSAVSEGVRFLLAGMGCQPGDRVVLSPLAPAYWLEGVSRFGLIPIYCDVMETFPVLDPVLVELLVPQGPKLIIADSCLGFLPDVAALQALGIPVIEDISQGMGGRFSSSEAGTLGTAVLAQFAPETLVAGAGGCVAGFRGDPVVALEPAPWELLSDLGASLVLSQWKDREIFAEKKRDHFRRLFLKLRSYPQPRQVGDADLVLPWFPLLVENGAKDVLAYARKHAVEADWAFRAQSHLNQESATDFCPRSRSFLYRTLVFPLYATISERDLSDLGKVISSLP